MMTLRQQQILQRLVECHIASGQPVSSHMLCARSGMRVSSATIRNELATLEEAGYVTHPYTSAGCIPTERAYKEYIMLTQERPLELVASEKKALEDVVDRHHSKDTRDRFRHIAQALAEVAHEAVYVAYSSDDVYYTGVSYLFQKPECADHQIAIHMSEMLDNLSDAMTVLAQQSCDTVTVRIGSENPFGVDCATVWIYDNDEEPVVFGILGPVRMPYQKHIARLQYIQDHLL